LDAVSRDQQQVAHLEVLQRPERLAALRRLALANLSPEEPFDRLTRLAAALCSAPTALITFVGDDLEHFKSTSGLPEPLALLRQTPLDYSICQYAVASGQPLVVPDARGDPVLRTNLAVTKLGVAAYAGAPLITAEGHCLGTLSVLDWKPRYWTDEQVAMLQDLAATAVTELELRQELADRARIETALRESEERFRFLIEQTSDIIAVVDEGGLVRYGSPSVEPVLGYDPQELLGRSAVELIHPDDRPRVLQAHLAVLRDPRAAQGGVEFRFKHKDGTWRMLEALGSAVQHRSAGSQAVLTLRDVTDRRGAEAALRESEERLRLTLDAAKCGIWDWDIQTNRVSWSERVYELHGLTPETFGGTADDFLAAVHPEDVGRVGEAIRRALEERADYGVEFRVIQPGTGRTRWVWTNGQVLFGEDGTPRRMLGATLDTTERREAEEALRASHEQLRQLARRLDEVREEELTRISREIHDELGHALTALRLDLSWLVPKLQRNRGPVREKAAEMLVLVDDTIDSVRRIASQLRPPVLEDLGLAAAIDARLERFSQQTGLQVELQAGTDEVPGVARRGLYRIVQEALTNIARHSQARSVRVRLECSPALVVLEIADDGVGIAPGMIANPRSLGLVGMRERAAALGADFHVAGGPDCGTTIRVTLPRPPGDA
jgi:two-component system, NarL family, sensor histidine kinase UhpB